MVRRLVVVWIGGLALACAEAGERAPDARVVDAPQADARADASRADAPAPDASRPDASRPDAQRPDAPPPDAAPPDALPTNGCAAAGPREAFSPLMVGCPGAVTWAARDSLCAPGFTSCAATWWVSLRAGAPPAHAYWTSDPLGYSGTGTGDCAALLSGGTACPADRPMRVCPGATDPEGNTCTWSACGLGATTPSEYFGGCITNATAGTLCCRPPCADGSTEDAFPNGMFGCAGAATYAGRAALCGAGYHVCSAAEWVARHGGAAPTHDYWTDDVLKYNGSIGSCYVSTIAGTDCPADRPMRVCGAATDAEGNTCTWMGCGYETTTPNRYFGGCVSNPTAGALCCAD